MRGKSMLSGRQVLFEIEGKALDEVAGGRGFGQPRRAPSDLGALFQPNQAGGVWGFGWQNGSKPSR